MTGLLFLKPSIHFVSKKSLGCRYWSGGGPQCRRRGANAKCSGASINRKPPLVSNLVASGHMLSRELLHLLAGHPEYFLRSNLQ